MANNNFILTKEYLHEIFEYSEGNLFWKSDRANGKIKKGTKAGTIAVRGNITINLNRKLYKAHRLIFFMFHGFMPYEVDHKDKNALNNKIENLRPIHDDFKNKWNVGLSKRNTSGEKGVCWDKKRNKWVAKCYFMNKDNHLGYYKDFTQAVQAVRKFREENHGEYVRHQ